jgi:glycine cleavage system regulatory protein
MQRSLVMTAISEDRPGVVESLASVVAEHGGNWTESRMTRLGGQFAGIVRVEVTAEKEHPLTLALKNLAGRGLTVIVHTDHAKPAVVEGRLSVLEIVGHDRPGIVQQISSALASFGVNVEELDTECVSAAMSGEMLFKAHARLSVPESCNRVELQQRLEKIAADLFVDISLAALPAENRK